MNMLEACSNVRAHTIHTGDLGLEGAGTMPLRLFANHRSCGPRHLGRLGLAVASGKSLAGLEGGPRLFVIIAREKGSITHNYWAYRSLNPDCALLLSDSAGIAHVWIGAAVG